MVLQSQYIANPDILNFIHLVVEAALRACRLQDGDRHRVELFVLLPSLDLEVELLAHADTDDEDHGQKRGHGRVGADCWEHLEECVDGVEADNDVCVLEEKGNWRKRQPGVPS